jgi:hypothetical protein
VCVVRLARRLWREALVVVLAYSLGAALLMWPVLADPRARVYGLPSDPLSEVWRLAQFRSGEIGLINNAVSSMANVPSGIEVRRVVDVSQSAYDLLAATLAQLVNPVLAYNLLVFVGVAMTGIATYFSVRALGGRPLGAATAGALLVVAPMHMVEAQLHAPLSYAAPLPLLFLLGVKALERPSTRRGAGFGAALAACGYFTAYLLLEAIALGLGIAAAAIVLTIGDSERLRPLAKAAFAAALAAFVVLAPLIAILAGFKAEIDAAAARPSVEATTYSLEPSAYLHRGSATYAGLFAAVLAAVALFLPSVPRLIRIAAPLVALTALALSLKADTALAGVDLPMPSELVHALVPYWRVFGRVAIVVSLAVAVLAAFTVDRLAARGRLGLAFGFGVAVIAITDLIRSPPPPAADLGRADPVAVVLSGGAGPVAEYPLFGFDNHMIGPYLFRQLRHGRPLLNGAIAGTTSADISTAASDLGGPQARAALALAGVREVVTNPETLSPPRQGFALIARFGDRAVYRVVSPSREIAVAAIRGAYPPEPAPDSSSFQWVRAGARLAVVARRAGPVEVNFDAISHATPRRVRFGTARTVVVGTVPTKVRLCLRAGPGGTATVAVAATPPAARLPGGDARVATIGMYHLTAHPGCRVHA